MEALVLRQLLFWVTTFLLFVNSADSEYIAPRSTGALQLTPQFSTSICLQNVNSPFSLVFSFAINASTNYAISANGTFEGTSGSNYVFVPANISPSILTTNLTVTNISSLTQETQQLFLYSNGSLMQTVSFRFFTNTPMIQMNQPATSYFETSNLNLVSPFVWTYAALQDSQTCEVQLATDSNFVNVIFNISLPINSSQIEQLTINQSMLATGTYYWRIISSNPCGNSTISSSFKILSTALTTTQLIIIVVFSVCIGIVILFGVFGFLISYILRRRKKKNTWVHNTTTSDIPMESMEEYTNKKAEGGDFYTWYDNLGKKDLKKPKGSQRILQSSGSAGQLSKTSSQASSFSITGNVHDPPDHKPSSPSAPSNQCLVHDAVRTNDMETFKKLVEGGADLNQLNMYRETPLHVALHCSHVEMVQELLKHHVDVNILEVSGEAPIHYIASNNQLEMLDLLKKHPNFNVDRRKPDGSTALHLATDAHLYQMMEKLIKLGADVNAKRKDKWFPLYIAAYNNDFPAIELLVKSDAKVNEMCTDNWTALHVACAEADKQINTYLVKEALCKVNSQTAQGTTPLFIATSRSKRSVARMLLEAGADVNLSAPGGWKPIHAACFNESRKLLDLLLEFKAELSPTCEEIKCYTPLHILIATSRPRYELIRILVDKGADINAPSKTGSTPLHVAVYHGHRAIVELLVKAGADLNAITLKGFTPLQYACMYGEKQIAFYLAEKMKIPNQSIPSFQNRPRHPKEMDPLS